MARSTDNGHADHLASGVLDGVHAVSAELPVVLVSSDHPGTRWPDTSDPFDKSLQAMGFSLTSGRRTPSIGRPGACMMAVATGFSTQRQTADERIVPSRR
ncbi:hypothetical protein I545_6983 [Mycobacterium kansasii 662]|uniref:Uncharacterized protein n=1 Tax=Mycobacterium kansasii 662 TaxID=1299326 RepID=X7XNC5_MYCKA|nr:hypothetical protein I545_6983 [Mycobacterium kansasii 662]